MMVDAEALPVQKVADVEQQARVPWLVEGLWADQGVGFLCGNPKSNKTWVALDLALSVATRTPALGRYDVVQTGPVLVFAAEDAPAMIRSRLSGMARQRGLALAEVPIYLVLASSLRLEKEADQERLEATVDQIRPKLVILDPFVRLSGADENSAREVSAVLAYLRALQRVYHVALLVVHHTRKQVASGSPSGLALRGSGDFWAWADTTLYLHRRREVLQLKAEHRNAPAGDPIPLDLRDDSGDGPYLRVRETSPETPVLSPAPLDERILEALRSQARPCKLETVRAQVRVRMQTVVDRMRDLERDRRVKRVDGGWDLTSETDCHGSNTRTSGETEAGSAEEQPAKG